MRSIANYIFIGLVLASAAPARADVSKSSTYIVDTATTLSGKGDGFTP